MTTTEQAAAGRPMRLVRSVAAALLCVTAAAIGHRAAGGVLPGQLVLGAFAGSAGVAWLLSARRLTAGQLLGLLVLCQVGVHATSGEMTMGAAMVSAHVLATVASAVVLTRGESFAWSVAERLALRAVGWLRAVLLLPVVDPLAPVATVRTVRDVRLAHSRPLRGPPVGLA